MTTFDPTNPRNIPCPHCGHDRDEDLKKPCPLCKSRKYPLFGYNYAHEMKAFKWALIVVLGVALLAAIAGALFLIYINSI